MKFSKLLLLFLILLFVLILILYFMGAFSKELVLTTYTIDSEKISGKLRLENNLEITEVDAPAVILIAGDTTKTDLWRENCAISATILQLAIVDAGLASCWVHVGGRPRLKDEPQGAQAEDFVRDVVGVPADWAIECAIALGYSDFEPKPLPEWDAESSIVWHTRV